MKFPFTQKTTTCHISHLNRQIKSFRVTHCCKKLFWQPASTSFALRWNPILSCPALHYILMTFTCLHLSQVEIKTKTRQLSPFALGCALLFLNISSLNSYATLRIKTASDREVATTLFSCCFSWTQVKTLMNKNTWFLCFFFAKKYLLWKMFHFHYCSLQPIF